MIQRRKFRACLKIGDVSSGDGFWPLASNFFAGILADFKENYAVQGVKAPLIGHVDMFQTSPSIIFNMSH